MRPTASLPPNSAARCSRWTIAWRPRRRIAGPVEDSYAALKWVADNAKKLDVDLTRLGIKGESAGGGLAAALALLARDRGEVKLAFQHLIYPMIDDRTCVAADPHPYVGEFVWTPDHNRFGWASPSWAMSLGSRACPTAAAAAPRAEEPEQACRRPICRWGRWTCSWRRTWNTPGG